MIYISLEDTRVLFDVHRVFMDKIVYSITNVDWLRYFRRNFHFSIVNYVLVLCPILCVTINKLMSSVNINIEPNNKWRCCWWFSNFMRNNRKKYFRWIFKRRHVTPCWSDNNPFVRRTTVDDYWIVKMNEFSWRPKFRNVFVNEHIESLKMHATLHCHHRFSAGELWHSLPTNHQFTIHASMEVHATVRSMERTSTLLGTESIWPKNEWRCAEAQQKLPRATCRLFFLLLTMRCIRSDTKIYVLLKSRLNGCVFSLFFSYRTVRFDW